MQSNTLRVRITGLILNSAIRRKLAGVARVW